MSIQTQQQPVGPRVATADFSETKKFDDMYERIKQADSLEEWSKILRDHISWGNWNKKLADHVAVFNLNCATHCPNRWTDSCQVDGDECYAVKTENRKDNAYNYRQRQEYLWDCLDAQTWADAFLEVIKRKIIWGNLEEYSDVDLRFSQAGDFRFQGDVHKAEQIARILEPYGIDVYTYTASDFLDWSNVEVMTVNASNTKRDYGDRTYTAIPKNLSPEDTRRVEDDAVQCPNELSDGEILCGECRLCINAEGPDVYISLH